MKKNIAEKLRVKKSSLKLVKFNYWKWINGWFPFIDTILKNKWGKTKAKKVLKRRGTENVINLIKN